jgi:hypothetical protein
VFFLDTYDKYGNPILVRRPQQLYFSIPTLALDVNYNQWVSNLNNGTYKVSVVIYKVHQAYYETDLSDTITMHYTNLKFSFDPFFTDYLEMQNFLSIDISGYSPRSTTNLPRSIYITPSECSSNNPEITHAHLD